MADLFAVHAISITVKPDYKVVSCCNTHQLTNLCHEIDDGTRTVRTRRAQFEL